MGALIFLMMLAFPLLAVLLFSWWIRRQTGYDPRGQADRPLFKRDEIDFLKLPDFYHSEKTEKRESKSNPHYDALVDAEWKAKRLEDSLPETDSDEVHSLSELLEERKKN